MHMIHESTSMRSSGEREDSTHNEQFATVGGVDKSLVDEAGVLRLDSGSNASALSCVLCRLGSAYECVHELNEWDCDGMAWDRAVSATINKCSNNRCSSVRRRGEALRRCAAYLNLDARDWTRVQRSAHLSSPLVDADADADGHTRARHNAT